MANQRCPSQKNFSKSPQLINLSHNVLPSQCDCVYCISNLKHIRKTYQSSAPIAKHKPVNNVGLLFFKQKIIKCYRKKNKSKMKDIFFLVLINTL